MKLEIFLRANRTRVDMIRTYTFVQYVDEFNGMGSFSITIPINDESLEYLYEGNFIYFDDGVMGIVKGIRTSQDSDVEIEVYGFLTNYILSQRVFEVTKKYYDTVPVIARSMVSDKFITVGSDFRKISAITLSSDSKYFPTFEDKVTFQNTGDTVFDAMSELFLTYNLGMELYPVISNYSETNPSTNLSALEFRILQPHDRTIDNTQGNTPVVFSFDLNNLSSLEYEEDARTACNVVYVASEGEGEDRTVIEVGEKNISGFYRIEGYQDARDLQTQSGGGSGGGGGGGSDDGNATVVGGAFEVAKWYLVDDGGWTKDSDLHWHSSVAVSAAYALDKTICFAINVPENYSTTIKIVATKYMAVKVVLNNQVLYEKGTTGAFDDFVTIPLKSGVNNLRVTRWVPQVSGNTSETKNIEVYLYDFAADINTDGYLTTTADIWKPNIDESGNITWLKSAELSLPQERNIKGPKGDQGTSPHIDPVSGNWMLGEVDTNVRADGIDGTTPHIDSVTGNWFLGTTNTGVQAQGPQGNPSTVPGPPGTPGTNGVSPTIVPNSGNTDDVYKLDITTVDGVFTTPNLRGQDGDGAMPDLSNYVTKDMVPFKFGIDSSGNYGYYKNDEDGNPTDEFVVFGGGSSPETPTEGSLLLKYKISNGYLSTSTSCSYALFFDVTETNTLILNGTMKVSANSGSPRADLYLVNESGVNVKDVVQVLATSSGAIHTFIDEQVDVSQLSGYVSFVIKNANGRYSISTLNCDIIIELV